MTRRRIHVTHQRVRIRRSIEANQPDASAGRRGTTARSARQASRLQPLPVRCCPSCGDVLVERHRLLGVDGSLFRRMHCTCGYVRVFKEGSRD